MNQRTSSNRLWIACGALAALAIAAHAPMALAQTPPSHTAARTRAASDHRLDPALGHMLTTGTVDPQLISADPDAGQSSEEPRIPLLVRGRVDLDAIARLNGEVQTQAGPVTTILAPLASIPAMLDLNGVEAIDAPRSLELLLNTSTANIAAPLMWGGTPPSYPGYSGRGVLIGIVDTGIDVAHADFRTSANQTRIKYLWDQTGSGSPPAGFCCGREYTEAQINAGSVSEVDNNGHGTHIAGIAASNGRATGLGYPMYRYVGVAPEADLVVVKTNQMLIETDVINGVNYIFQKATSLGKDCVVLLAVGHNRGGHDGSHSLDVALSALTGPRKIIVVAAGNQGGQALHAQINPASGQTSTTTFTIPTYTPAPSVTEQLGIEGWHGTGARFNVKLTSPGGFTTGWVAPGAARVTVSSTDGTFFLDNDLTTNSKGAKQVLAWIWDAGNGYTPRVGTWRLDYQRLSGTTTGLLDAWIADWKFGSGNVSPVFTSMVSYTQLIQTPATGDSIISVGAFSTKVRWKTMSGDSSYFFDNPPLEAIASFSSPGPRRDGVQRPDLVAPGQGVGSSLAAAASPMILNTFKLEDGAHWIYRGTSAAAAHVAGAVALLLQQTPHMSPSAARLALRAKTKVDSYTGAVPNATWGYGKLHFTSSTPTGVDDGFAGSLEFYPASPNPTRGEIGFDFVISMADLPTGTESVRLRIFDMSGREVAVLSGQTTIGRQHLVWNGLGSNNRPAAGGVYFGRLEVGTHRAVRKFIRLS